MYHVKFSTSEIAAIVSVSLREKKEEAQKSLAGSLSAEVRDFYEKVIVNCDTAIKELYAGEFIFSEPSCPA